MAITLVIPDELINEITFAVAKRAKYYDKMLEDHGVAPSDDLGDDVFIMWRKQSARLWAVVRALG